MLSTSKSNAADSKGEIGKYFFSQEAQGFACCFERCKLSFAIAELCMSIKAACSGKKRNHKSQNASGKGSSKVICSEQGYHVSDQVVQSLIMSSVEHIQGCGNLHFTTLRVSKEGLRYIPQDRLLIPQTWKYQEIGSLMLVMSNLNPFLVSLNLKYVPSEVHIL